MREEEDTRGGERPAKGDKRRKTKMGPKMRIGLRRGKSKGRVNAKKRRRRRRRRKEEMENGFTKSRVG